ncbi:hypothetical protein C8J57DRAFT_1589010 [Mycena rebaudengoi]|nr:hypothetical protein C8J57DRAFT_1589010 [Mycena rebaudengoi]
MDRRTVHYPYGEGAPHGDPFQVATNTSSHESRFIGLGLPPQTAAPRSTSLDTTPVAFNRYSAYNSNGWAASVNVLPARMVNTSTTQNMASNTPTPSHRQYLASRTLPPAQPQFAIPEERTQLDQLLDMMQMLLHDTGELKEPVASIEGTLAQSATSDSAPMRGFTAQRGGQITQAKTRAAARNTHQPRDIHDHPPIDPLLSGTTTDDTDREPESLDEDRVELDSMDLTQTERCALQHSYVTQAFRCRCNVPGRNWPDPEQPRVNLTTNEVYPTPFLRLTVKDERNKRIFIEVGEQVFQELQDKSCWPAKLSRLQADPDPAWDVAYLGDLAKQSFRGFKKQWNETRKIETALRAEANRSNNRRLKRRQRAKGSEESRDAWKVRLAAAANKSLDPDSLKNTEYSNLIRAMEEFKVDGREDTAPLHQLVYDRVCLGRVSNRIPKYAPYNFGISKQWFDANGRLPAHKTLFKDWNGWPEPADCAPILGQYDIIDDAEVVVES